MGQTSVSLVTLAGTSKLASIITRYRDFVSQASSPLPGYFPESAYHMVLGADINQGDSWQFAVAIAHLLAQHERLGDGNVGPGEQVIVATGEIDAVTTELKLISHLAQKCLRAQRQILQWQQIHCRIDFMVPADNYRQPLPDIQWALTPIESIAELEHRFIEKGLIPDVNTITQLPSHRQTRSFHLSKLHPIQLRSDMRQWWRGLLSKASKISVKRASSAILVLLMVSSILYVFIPSEKPQITLAYEVKTLGQCAGAQPVVLQFPSAPVAQLPELKLNGLCDLRLSLPSSVESVWLIADSYALLPLTASEQDQYVWSIPLPTWQQATRQYTLMTFTEAPDESDKQSMLAYLLELHKREEAVSLQSLVNWSNQQAVNTQFVQHQLIFEETF
jgi:hypothetical protein